MTQPAWYQEALLDVEVLELNVRIGVIPSADHVQVLVELKDPTDGRLIAQESVHHRSMAGLWEAIAWAKDTATQLLGDQIQPF